MSEPDITAANPLVISDLGYRLSAAQSPAEAATIIAEVADTLLGWDAFSLDLFDAESGTILPVLTMDTLDGQRVAVPHVYTGVEPSPIAWHTIREGGLRILRDVPEASSPLDTELTPFGDVSRPSASLLFVPVRYASRVNGILSIQSYTFQAYAEEDMTTLQALADLCGGALERIRIEESLRVSEERLRLALEAGGMGAWESNFQTGRVTFSEELRRMRSLPPDTSPTFEKFLAQVHPDDRRRVHDAIERAYDTGQFAVEYRFLGQEGTYRWTANQGRFFRDAEGKPLRVIGIVSDISERKRLEEQLLQAQKMESIGRLAGGIAHDFNNLLTAILGYAELAEAELSEDHPAQNFLGNVRKASERAAALTSQLLAFARKQVVEPRPADLNALLLNMEPMLRRLIGEHIELVLRIKNDLGVVRVDPNQFGQVVMNLAVNARDAMSEGGKLTLETAHVTLDRSYTDTHLDVIPGEYVLFAVSDTGIGMTDNVKAHLFEPFFTTKEPGKGTGLGLATCYDIVKQCGGHIWAYSEPGHGSTFKIYLPRVDAVAETTDATSEGRNRLLRGTETLVLVEDESLVRNIAATVLRDLGYTVLEAANGNEALSVMQHYTEPIHLLVTDVVMPQMGGRELAEKVQALYPGLRLLYTSGYTDDAVVLHAVLESEQAFLQKPFTPAALARKVREVLEQTENIEGHET